MNPTEFPLVPGTGQSTVLIAAAVATGQRVLLISPLVMHHMRERELKTQFPAAVFPQCVTPQWVAKHGVPLGTELCVLDVGVPTSLTSNFWKAMRATTARIWVYDCGGHG